MFPFYEERKDRMMGDVRSGRGNKAWIAPSAGDMVGLAACRFGEMGVRALKTLGKGYHVNKMDSYVR